MTIDLSPFDRTEGMSIMPTENADLIKRLRDAAINRHTITMDDVGASKAVRLLNVYSALMAEAAEALSTAPASPPSSVGEEVGLEVTDEMVRVACDAYRQSIWDNPSKPYRPRDIRAALSAVVGTKIGSFDSVLNEVGAERCRQRDVEGWSSEHDDSHAGGELALAAACYALAGGYRLGDDGIREEPNPTFDASAFIQRWWPWHSCWWKPKDKRRNLVKAGALIVAEIERLDRTPTPYPRSLLQEDAKR